MTTSTPQPRIISGLGEAPPQRDPSAARSPGAAPRGGAEAAARAAGAAPLPVLDLDQRTYARALDCVHCGLCLPACPTYTQNGLEGDSPRGRIYLMKGLADGKIDATESVIRHLDLCLDCRACETACPSGVVYHELIEETREKLTALRKVSMMDRLINAVFFHVFPHPRRLKLALLPARLLQRLGLFAPLTRLTAKLPGGAARVVKMQQMLPTHGPLWESKLDAFYPAEGERNATVALLAGCIGSVLFQHTNRQTIRLLQHAGCDVIVARTQGCCGAIHHHGGRVEQARDFAKANVDALLNATRAGSSTSPAPDESLPGTSAGRDYAAHTVKWESEGKAVGTVDGPARAGGPARVVVDYIVSNVAGCGAMLQEYAHLLRDDAQYAEKARQFSERCRDISEVLVELDPPRPTRRLERVVTYHDACHLAHAQKVTTAPRQLLGWIAGLTVIALPESDMCCGAAGTYNLSQPQMARQLAERKIRHIQETAARTCVTGNAGCAMQIQSEADRLGVELHVTHPVSLLYEAYFGDREAALTGS